MEPEPCLWLLCSGAAVVGACPAPSRSSSGLGRSEGVVALGTHLQGLSSTWEATVTRAATVPRAPILHSHWPHSLWFGETPEAPAFGTHELRQSHEAPEWLESAGRSPQARGQNLLRGQESAVPASRSPVAPHPHPGLALPQRTRALRHARPDQTPGPALGLHRRLEVGRAQMCPGLEFPQKVMF